MTKIEWTDATWNPIVGCSRVSEGCRNCYAATLAASARMQVFPQYNEVKRWDGTVSFVSSQLEKPFRWKKPKRIFVGSMTDIFHANISDEWRDIVFAAIAINQRHTFQILTKRPDKAAEYFNSDRRSLYKRWENATRDHLFDLAGSPGLVGLNKYFLDLHYPLPNLWVGVTVENQEAADRRINILQEIPASIRWLSIEPLLGSIDLYNWSSNIDQVIVGGESGKGYRDMQIEWLLWIASWCDKYNVPLFVKQDSTFHSGRQGRIPEDLWVRKEFPKTQAHTCSN